MTKIYAALRAARGKFFKAQDPDEWVLNNALWIACFVILATYILVVPFALNRNSKHEKPAPCAKGF